ncbi:MAG: hypothetical protein DBY37_06920 [Desulfovibrionaceae bacterium]|nr:MAG: hypothetical protein DBY37_06920 [Desulfovibrionaceae bacterium]
MSHGTGGQASHAFFRKASSSENPLSFIQPGHLRQPIWLPTLSGADCLSGMEQFFEIVHGVRRKKIFLRVYLPRERHDSSAAREPDAGMNAAAHSPQDSGRRRYSSNILRFPEKWRIKNE